MRNNSRIFIAVIALLFVLLIATELLRPKPIDWSFDFTPNNTKPFSVKAFHSLVGSIFKEKVHDVHEDIYSQIINAEDTIAANYLFINVNFKADSTSINELLYLVDGGSNVFIAAQYFDDFFSDTLHFDTAINYSSNGIYDDIGLGWKPDTSHRITCWLHHTNLPVDSFRFASRGHDMYFDIDLKKQGFTVLGSNEEKQPNFIKIPFGKGNFYLHSNPYLFTNYHLLTDNHAQYAAAAISHLPSDLPLWFDLNYVNAVKESDSLFRFLLSRESLRWALYLATALLLMFLLFESKRKQRYIPIISPLRNTTIDFVKTIAMLYYQDNNHKDLVDKKITYFWAYLHQKYHTKITYTLDFYQFLAQKTAMPLSDIEQLFEHIQQLKQQNSVSEESLLLLTQQLDRFYSFQ